MKMASWTRAIGMGFAIELLLILAAGSVAAWQMDEQALHVTTLIGGAAWLLLATATFVPVRSRLGSWQGTLQFAACWLIFPLFKAIRTIFIRHTADATLLRLDRALWHGASLPEHLLRWERPWLSELVSAGYFLFYFVVLLPAIWFSLRRHEQEAKAFFAGLTLMYLTGFVGYVLVPASGPYMAFPEVFPYPVHGGPATAFLTGIVKNGITGMDVFPSLHSGIGIYVFGFFALGGYRRIACMLAPVIAALILATVYLRYHYGIDLLCGIALALLVLAFVQRFRKESAI